MGALPAAVLAGAPAAPALPAQAASVAVEQQTPAARRGPPQRWTATEKILAFGLYAVLHDSKISAAIAIE